LIIFSPVKVIAKPANPISPANLGSDQGPASGSIPPTVRLDSGVHRNDILAFFEMSSRTPLPTTIEGLTKKKEVKWIREKMIQKTPNPNKNLILSRTN
jgi:hypothetical protein